jgi:hypothetical protein
MGGCHGSHFGKDIQLIHQLEWERKRTGELE